MSERLVLERDKNRGGEFASLLLGIDELTELKKWLSKEKGDTTSNTFRRILKNFCQKEFFGNEKGREEFLAFLVSKQTQEERREGNGILSPLDFAYILFQRRKESNRRDIFSAVEILESHFPVADDSPFCDVYCRLLRKISEATETVREEEIIKR